MKKLVRANINVKVDILAIVLWYPLMLLILFGLFGGDTFERGIAALGALVASNEIGFRKSTRTEAWVVFAIAGLTMLVIVIALAFVLVGLGE